MRAFLLIVLASLAVGCTSSTRIREVHCRGMAVPGRTRLARSQLASCLEGPLVDCMAIPSAVLSCRQWNTTAVFLPAIPAEARTVTEANRRSAEDDLCRRLIDQQARYRQSVDWYRRVSRRMQTRLDKDEMLYSTLGTLVASLMM